MSTVLITGTSTGFGHLTARALAAAGHTVFATMRNSAKQNADRAAALRDYAASVAGSITVLDLDVTDDASVEAAVAAASADGPLDVVVNNAGSGVAGWAEAFTVEQFQRVFDTNLLGSHRVNRAVLPAMRARGDGLIVQVTSTAGRFVMPFCAPYIASKFALEGYAETLRYEVAPSGVEVVIVEPGAYGTNFKSGMVAAADVEREKSYGDQAELPHQVWSGMLASLDAPGAPDPQEVADAIVGVVGTPKGARPVRVVVDAMMGDGIRGINGLSDQVQQGLFGAIGMAHMLSVKK